MNSQTIIFTDGASRGNPGPGGWGAIILENDTVREIGEREDATTNNRMEIMAAIGALSVIAVENPITIHTDSSYLINGITKWVSSWQRNGWKTKAKEEVLNRDLWERLTDLASQKEIEWNYIGGHSGIKGNERCDVIATSFADKAKVDLYEGSRADYPIHGIEDLSAAKEKVSKKAHSKAKAYSYVSMVDGKIEIHATWAECEARVKGKRGARFQKAISPEHEAEITAQFKNETGR